MRRKRDKEHKAVHIGEAMRDTCHDCHGEGWKPWFMKWRGKFTPIQWRLSVSDTVCEKCDGKGSKSGKDRSSEIDLIVLQNKVDFLTEALRQVILHLGLEQEDDFVPLEKFKLVKRKKGENCPLE